MKGIASVLSLLLLMAVLPAVAQELTRDDKLRKIHELRSELNTLELDVLQPDSKDIEAAQKLGGTAIRLLSREMTDGLLSLRGGGSFYSFARQSHEYGQGSDINLERGNLSVGFAGGDYGLMADLGTVPLSSITLSSPRIEFLANYRPPTNLDPDIRNEQRRSRNYETPTGVYTSSVKAIAGRTYILRSINFDRSDVLVAFTVGRKDADASQILFWRLLKKFETPPIIR